MLRIHAGVDLLCVLLVRLGREEAEPFGPVRALAEPPVEGEAHQLLVNPGNRPVGGFRCGHPGLLRILHHLGDVETLGKVCTDLDLGRVDSEGFRLEQDALRNDIKAVKNHRLDLELLGTQELEIRVCRTVLDFLDGVLHYFERHEVVLEHRRFLALVLRLLHCVLATVVFGHDLCQLGIAFTVLFAEAVREN